MSRYVKQNTSTLLMAQHPQMLDEERLNNLLQRNWWKSNKNWIDCGKGQESCQSSQLRKSFHKGFRIVGRFPCFLCVYWVDWTSLGISSGDVFPILGNPMAQTPSCCNQVLHPGIWTFPRFKGHNFDKPTVCDIQHKTGICTSVSVWSSCFNL